jgi:hypothetical protein
MSITLQPPGKESWEHESNPSSPWNMEQHNAVIFYFVTRTCMKEYPPIVAPPPPLVEEQQVLVVLEEERRKTRESWLHSWDQRLRSWIGMVAQLSRKDTGAANKARAATIAATTTTRRRTTTTTTTAR